MIRRLLAILQHRLWVELPPCTVDTRQPPHVVSLELRLRNARNLRAWRIGRAHALYHVDAQELLAELHGYSVWDAAT